MKNETLNPFKQNDLFRLAKITGKLQSSKVNKTFKKFLENPLVQSTKNIKNLIDDLTRSSSHIVNKNSLEFYLPRQSQSAHLSINQFENFNKGKDD